MIQILQTGMGKRSSQVNAVPGPEAFREKLKELGFKATPQRMAVHEAMIELVHASADMVAGHIAAKSSTGVTVSSVYNILSGMSDMGIYARRLSPESKMWFDVNPSPHLHAYDSEKGEYIDIINDELMKSLEDRLKRTRIKGYRIERSDIQLICRPSRKTIKK